MNLAKSTPSKRAIFESIEIFEGCLSSIFAHTPHPTVAVLIVGLDGFKALNEILGYAFSAEIMEVCEQRLQSALREHDRILRLPGDEFLLLLNPIALGQDATVVANRLTELLQRPYVFQGEIVNIRANIGIALAPQNGTKSETLLKRAGIALRGAKTFGWGSVQTFEMAMEGRMIARHALTVDLRKALLLHQLEVHYQPQIDIKSRTLTGFEALLRWRHPKLGWISPAEFIPVAEEIGMICVIGEWVLRTACRQAALLPEGLVIAVNASPVQFRTGGFLESVERALLVAGLSANKLEVEITEGVLMQNSPLVLSTIDSLHTMGVRLAMDDFGTGYSSLAQLAKLPFDTIKIDRSLVGGSSQQRAIVRSIVVLGNGLGMATLAEGIETEEELSNVHSDDCSLAQGYLFGKAVPASELKGVLARLPLVRTASPEVDIPDHDEVTPNGAIEDVGELL